MIRLQGAKKGDDVHWIVSASAAGAYAHVISKPAFAAVPWSCCPALASVPTPSARTLTSNAWTHSAVKFGNVCGTHFAKSANLHSILIEMV